MGIFSAIGSIFGAGKAAKEARRDREYQQLFAQQGLGWKIEDGKRYGLHPLESIGGVGASYQPVGDGGAGQMYANAGRSVDRAIQNKMTNNVLQSEIDLNNANRDLVIAQAETIRRDANNARNLTTKGSPTTSTENGDGPEVTQDVLRRFVNPDGTSSDIPVGPDVSEVVMGGIIYTWNAAKKAFFPKKNVKQPHTKRPSKPKVVVKPKKSSSSTRRNR